MGDIGDICIWHPSYVINYLLLHRNVPVICICRFIKYNTGKYVVAHNITNNTIAVQKLDYVKKLQYTTSVEYNVTLCTKVEYKNHRWVTEDGRVLYG